MKTFFHFSRLTKERDLLQRQKTSLSVVTDNLQLVQVQLEGADKMQKFALQVNSSTTGKLLSVFLEVLGPVL